MFRGGAYVDGSTFDNAPFDCKATRLGGDRTSLPGQVSFGSGRTKLGLRHQAERRLLRSPW